MIIVYNGSRPYLPLLACSLHFGLTTGAEAFLQRGLQWDWRREPLYIIGKDRAGNSVGCLVHGRHQAIYRRALTGTGAIFGLELACPDLDRLLADPLVRLKACAAQHSKWCERRFREQLARLVSSQLRSEEEER